MFSYQTVTKYNIDKVYTFTYPVNNELSRVSFVKNYPIREPEFYQDDNVYVLDFPQYRLNSTTPKLNLPMYLSLLKSELYEWDVKKKATDRTPGLKYFETNVRIKENLKEDPISYYSVIFFYEEKENKKIRYVKTNKNEIANLYDTIEGWNPYKFVNLYIPPRSKLYLFDKPNYQGYYIKFENTFDHMKLLTYNLDPENRNVSSLKWVTEFPTKLNYVLNEGVQYYKPLHFSNKWALTKDNSVKLAPIGLPIYKLTGIPYKYPKISNLHNS